MLYADRRIPVGLILWPNSPFGRGRRSERDRHSGSGSDGYPGPAVVDFETDQAPGRFNLSGNLVRSTVDDLRGGFARVQCGG